MMGVVALPTSLTLKVEERGRSSGEGRGGRGHILILSGE